MFSHHTIRAWRAILALTLALTCLFSLFSCGSGLHTITTTGNQYYDKETDTTYTALPASYEPIASGEEYGELNLSGMTYVLHEIAGLAPTDYLCSVYGDVYHDKDIDFPTFDRWELTSAIVCNDAAIVVALLTLDPTNTTHAPILNDLKQRWDHDNSVSYPSYLDPARAHTLRFTSNTAPGLYYSVKLLEYSEDVYDVIVTDAGEEVEVNLGRYFLYDRYSKRCVAISNDIFRLLDGDIAEGEENPAS